MNTNEVVTQQDFCNFVQKLSEEASVSERTLEEYLSALWLLVQRNKDSQVSFALLAQILSEALVSVAPPFDNDWLMYNNPPSELGQNQFVEDDFGFVKKMLLYQVADLHQMKTEGILDKPPHILYFGASRRGGTTWYNFEPTSFLSCANYGLQANSESTICDWSMLAIFLWLGQIYE